MLFLSRNIILNCRSIWHYFGFTTIRINCFLNNIKNNEQRLSFQICIQYFLFYLYQFFNKFNLFNIKNFNITWKESFFFTCFFYIFFSSIRKSLLIIKLKIILNLFFSITLMNFKLIILKFIDLKSF